MTFSQKIMSGVAVASLAASPAMAEVPRATAPGSETSEMAGGMEGGGWIAIAGVIAVVILAVLAASNDDDDDDPVSA